MRVMKAWVVLALWAAALGAVSGSCPACDVERCPETARECSHGLTKDDCGCCREGVCLLLENERCLGGLAETEPRKMSACGEFMECLPRTDPKKAEEWACRCERQEASCGMDNATYPSVCRLREAGTEPKHPGPCTTPPEIVSEPEVPASAAERDRLSLSCEAKGFPVPRLRWEFEGADGRFASLPGDDPSVAVHGRGGPEPFTVTSWVMVEALRATDGGTYICVAESSEGIARSGVSVHVRRKDA